MNAPCFKCPDRHSTCHSSCEKWKEYEAWKIKDYKEREDKFNRSIYTEVTKTAKKMKKLGNSRGWL